MVSERMADSSGLIVGLRLLMQSTKSRACDAASVRCFSAGLICGFLQRLVAGVEGRDG